MSNRTYRVTVEGENRGAVIEVQATDADEALQLGQKHIDDNKLEGVTPTHAEEIVDEQ